MNKHIFSNLPKEMQVSDYKGTCDLIVDKLKNNTDIKSIYLSSGTWIPGISDLDIIIIYHKNRKGISIPNFEEISEKAKYVLLHSFWKLDEESFKNLEYLVPGASLKLLHGKDILIRNSKNELLEKEYQFLHAVVIFDFLINKLLLFPRYLKYTKLDIRKTLGEVYSLVYTLDMLNLINAQTIDTDFPKRIRQLRKTWFINNQEENLKELMVLLEDSIDLILEIVIRLDDFVKKHNLPTNRSVFKNRKYHITFDKDWTKEKFKSNFFKGYIFIKRPFSDRILENFKLVLPESLSYFLMAYANQKGPLNDWIRKSLNNYQDIPINKGVYQHIKVVNDSVQTSIELEFTRIPFSYGYLHKKQTLISRLGEKLILFLRIIKI